MSKIIQVMKAIIKNSKKISNIIMDDKTKSAMKYLINLILIISLPFLLHSCFCCSTDCYVSCSFNPYNNGNKYIEEIQSKHTSFDIDTYEEDCATPYYYIYRDNSLVDNDYCCNISYNWDSSADSGLYVFTATIHAEGDLLQCNDTLYVTIVPDDTATSSCNGDTIMYDNRDENYYKIVQIGGQCWMAENIDIGIEYANFSNNNIIEKRCYNHCEIYGGLYDWNEMMQYDTVEFAKGICPDGWHIPSSYDWNVLFAGLSSPHNSISGKLKEKGYEHWKSPNIDATNESGFTALPGGGIMARGVSSDYNYSPDQINQQAIFWSSEKYSAYALYHYINSIPKRNVDHNPEEAYSVRCIKDSN